MPYLPSSFGHAETESLGVVAATSTGTLITASATANAKGAWVSLGSPAFDYEWINIGIGASSAAADYVFDLGIWSGTATASFAIASDLRISALKGAADLFLSYTLPIRIPKGQAGVSGISMRCASPTASATLRAIVTGSSSSPLGGPSFSRIRSLYTPANSRGIAIDPGATANTKGAWTTVGSNLSTLGSIDALIVGIGPNADVTRTGSATGLLDIGLSGTWGQRVEIPNLLWGFTTTSDTPFPSVYGPFPVTFNNNGTADLYDVVARAQSTNTTAGDRTLDLGVWACIR